MRKVYRLFKSTKTAVVLAGLMLPFLITGTIIPQNQSEAIYRTLFGKTTARVLQALKITDIYHSPWFLAIVALFFLNLTLGNLESLVTLVRALPKTGLRRPILLKMFTRVFHLFFLLMLAGFVLTASTKIDGAVLLKNGESSELRGLPGLKLKLNRFWIDYISFNNHIYTKDYFSDLELYDQGKLVAHRVIEVNAPLHYKDIWIYQAFYRQYVKVALVQNTDTLEVKDAQTGTPVVFQNISTSLLLDEYQMGRLFFFKQPQLVQTLDPTIPVYGMGDQHGSWRFIGYLTPTRPIELGGGKKLVLIKAYQASGFTYRKDVGVPFVFLGATLAGLFMFIVVFWRAAQEL